MSKSAIAEALSGAQHLMREKVDKVFGLVNDKKKKPVNFSEATPKNKKRVILLYHVKPVAHRNNTAERKWSHKN